MMAKNKHVLRQNQRSDKWDVYANTEGNVSFLKYMRKSLLLELDVCSLVLSFLHSNRSSLKWKRITTSVFPKGIKKI